MTGHFSLLQHTCRQRLTHPEDCPCRTGPQSPEHVLQFCALFKKARTQQWPHGALTLQEQMWGNTGNLLKTTTFIQTTGLTIWVRTMLKRRRWRRIHNLPIPSIMPSDTPTATRLVVTGVQTVFALDPCCVVSIAVAVDPCHNVRKYRCCSGSLDDNAAQTRLREEHQGPIRPKALPAASFSRLSVVVVVLVLRNSFLVNRCCRLTYLSMPCWRLSGFWGIHACGTGPLSSSSVNWPQSGIVSVIAAQFSSSFLFSSSLLPKITNTKCEILSGFTDQLLCLFNNNDDDEDDDNNNE